MNRSGAITLVVMLLVILVAISYFFWRDQSALQKRNNTSAAQALLIEEEGKSFTDLTGTAVNINDSFGKVMVVMSFASWCPQCGKDLETLGSLAKEYNAKGVTFMAINRSEDKYTAERYLSTLPPLPAELKVLLDSDDYYFSHSAGYAMPETVVFAEDGSIALQLHGEINKEEVKSILENVLPK